MPTMAAEQKIVGGVAYSTAPDLNSGTPWSDLALDDVKYGVQHGHSVGRIAVFVCRSEAEVAEMIAELGLNLRSV